MPIELGVVINVSANITPVLLITFTCKCEEESKDVTIVLPELCINTLSCGLSTLNVFTPDIPQFIYKLLSAAPNATSSDALTLTISAENSIMEIRNDEDKIPIFDLNKYQNKVNT
jgi:hypothetical protein